MKPVKNQTNDELEFNRADAEEAAIQAIRLHNPKLSAYLQERSDCEAEIQKRQRIRMARDMVRQHMVDPLVFQPNIRMRRLGFWKHNNSSYGAGQFRNGCFCLGWYRLNGWL